MKPGFLAALVLILLNSSVVHSAPAGKRPSRQVDQPPAVLDTVSTSKRGRENFQEIQQPLSAMDSLQGLKFQWQQQYGGQRDIGCFPTNDAVTSMPELFDWEIPGQVISGVRYNQLTALLVEAAKQLGVQLESCYAQLAELGQQVSTLESAVYEHTRRLNNHDTQISSMQAQLAAQQQAIVALQKKDIELEQKDADLQKQIDELRGLVQQLQAQLAASSSGH